MRVYTLSDMRSKKKLRVYTASEAKVLALNYSLIFSPQGRPLMLTYFLSDATAHFILEAGPDGSFAYIVISSDQLDREVVNNYTIRVSLLILNLIKATKKVSCFWSPHASPQTRTLAFLIFFFWGGGYETMSSCSHNCWIDWNSAMLYFKMTISLVDKKSMLLHRFLSRTMTRDWILFWGWA